MRRVVKFGGTSLATPKHIERAARTVAALVQMGEQIAVVVSAMGNETTEILSAISDATGGLADFKSQIALASIAEEKSVLLLTAALSAKKVTPVPFYPRKAETWPIIADSDDYSPIAVAKINEERDFTIRTQRTSNRFGKYVLPPLRMGQVPVISGFVVINSKDEIITLGRGGSDITAFVVGRYIEADEVVIVTDVKGIMSADPRVIEGAKLRKKLSVEDVEAIAGSGGRVIHPRALKYKSANMNVRVVDYRHQEELAKGGTRIYGESHASIYKNNRRLSIVLIMGSNWSRKKGILGRLSSILAENNIPISSASANSRFICFFLDEVDAEKARRLLHREIIRHKRDFVSLNVVGGVGEVRLSSAGFIETAGVLADFTRILAHNNINIIEVITSATDIYIYVKWESLEDACKLLTKLVKTRWSG